MDVPNDCSTPALRLTHAQMPLLRLEFWPYKCWEIAKGNDCIGQMISFFMCLNYVEIHGNHSTSTCGQGTTEETSEKITY